MDTPTPSSTIAYANKVSSVYHQPCEICYNEPISHWKILPCTHKMCYDCMLRMKNNACPWCRTKLDLKLNDTRIRFVDTIVIDSIPLPRRRNRPRDRSYSDPLPRRDSLFTPEDVIEYERVINNKLEKRRVVNNKKTEQTVKLPRDQRRGFRYTNASKRNIKQSRDHKYINLFFV